MTLATSSNLDDLHSETSISLRLIPDIGISGSGWIPDGNDTKPWIQADLQECYNIRAVVTQGCGDEGSWVTHYCVSYMKANKLIFYGGTSLKDSQVCQHIYTQQ